MEFKNEYIVICIIIIITVFFIINYDVYVLPKNEQLCKPIYVTKKTIDDKMIKKLSNPKESFKIKKNIDNEEKNIDNEEKNIDIKKKNIIDNDIKQQLKINDESINEKRMIPRKKIIINNILNILHKIPTVLNDEEIHFIINQISNIYFNSNSIDQFYNNVNNFNKLTPKNSNYVKLILYLIDNFDSSFPNDEQILNEPIFNKPLENKPILNKPLENDNNMFLISNIDSPIQNRMIEQASFFR